MCLRLPFRISALCPHPVDGEDSQLGYVFFKCSHRLRAYLSELQPLASATAVVSSSAPTLCRSVFTVEQANLALTAAFDASAAGDPIEFVFAPESRSDAVDFRRPPFIFSCLSSSGSTLFVPFRGMGILRLWLLLSLRLRTRTLTPICSKRFVR
jgi:hypothetical protein